MGAALRAEIELGAIPVGEPPPTGKWPVIIMKVAAVIERIVALFRLGIHQRDSGAQCPGDSDGAGSQHSDPPSAGYRGWTHAEGVPVAGKPEMGGRRLGKVNDRQTRRISNTEYYIDIRPCGQPATPDCRARQATHGSLNTVPDTEQHECCLNWKDPQINGRTVARCGPIPTAASRRRPRSFRLGKPGMRSWSDTLRGECTPPLRARSHGPCRPRWWRPRYPDARASRQA